MGSCFLLSFTEGRHRTYEMTDLYFKLEVLTGKLWIDCCGSPQAAASLDIADPNSGGCGMEEGVDVVKSVAGLYRHMRAGILSLHRATIDIGQSALNLTRTTAVSHNKNSG